MSIPFSIQLSCIQDDMKKVLDKSKKVYTITNKLSGQPSGYAFMLSDSLVSLDQVQLFPWQAPQSHGDLQPDKDKEGESESRGLPSGSLASDLDISEDSSVNSTVEDGLSVSGQELPDIKVEEILDMSSASKVDTDSNITEDTQIDVEETKFDAKNNNCSSAPTVFNSGTTYKSVAQTLAAEIASKLVEEKRLASGNLSQSGMDESSCASSKSSRETPVKQKYYQSVPGKISPGIQNRYGAFFTDVGVNQPEDYTKGKLVRCLLCKGERIIGVANFGRHLRTIHEPPVECDTCGGEFSSVRISLHKKVCIAKSFVSQKMTAQEPRLSENQLKSENEEVKFKLISATRPGIGIKVTLKRNVKIKKAMKIFAEKYDVNRKKLSFVNCGEKLTGDELVSELEGTEIIVHGKVNQPKHG